MESNDILFDKEAERNVSRARRISKFCAKTTCYSCPFYQLAGGVWTCRLKATLPSKWSLPDKKQPFGDPSEDDGK